jgi:hypothetical protein
VAAGGLTRDPTFLLLAEPDDVGAAEVARFLAARHGHDAVAVRGGAEVAFAPGLKFRPGANGGSGDPAVVLCRVHGAAAPWAARASPRDAAYAADEAGALLLAWLASLSRAVVNAPSSPGLSGPLLTRGHWLGLAARAGLPSLRLRMTTNARAHPVPGWTAQRFDGRAYGTRAVPPGPRPATLTEPVSGPPAAVLVAGREVRGPLAPHLHDAARRLAADVGCRLLGLTVGSGRDGQVVTEINPRPWLTARGHAAAAALLMERLASGRSG